MINQEIELTAKESSAAHELDKDGNLISGQIIKSVGAYSNHHGVSAGSTDSWRARSNKARS
jgi:hypothetical protein